jgi:signal transduction histidine kinase/CheY-like chemotaxis protein
VDTARNILLLDGDEQSAQDIQRFLKVSAFTFSISHAIDVFEGLSYLKNRKPDIVLLDVKILHQGNFELFKEQLQKERIPLILLGGIGTSDARRETELAGATDYLAKDKINLFHLQKAILNTLKINEAEAKLDKSSARFNVMQNAWRKVLDKTNSGILIVNRSNSILYASTLAYGILGNDEQNTRLNSYLEYRELDEEEIIELKGRNTTIRIKISDVDWFGERANLFVLEKLKSPEKALNILADETLLAFLNSIRQSVLLIYDMSVVFANKSALKKLNVRQSEIEQMLLSDIFEGTGNLDTDTSVSNLLNGQEAAFSLKQPDGSLKRVNAFMKPVQVGESFYQMVSFEIIETSGEKGVPAERSDGGKFTTQGILEMASHDLREPVRTILNYIHLVSDNLQKEKYEQAGEYAGYAMAEADRMEKLLNDLKVFVSLNDYKITLARVSVKMVVSDVLKQLKAKIDQSSAEINVAELPEVTADRELMEKLFYHLIDNAIKFQKKGKPPVIDIGFDKYEGNILFCVRDNGIGISKKYQDKIFELFERLNRVDEYPGNGLGLALSKRIVEMHGGKIWVESLPGFGSNFYFTFGSR